MARGVRGDGESRVACCVGYGREKIRACTCDVIWCLVALEIPWCVLAFGLWPTW